MESFMTHSAYRPDIDGLRSLAVLPVVIYHAMPGLLPGGFLGVDVFFVISGYLITLLMMREMSSGTFRFRDFYRRRIRRLAPAFIIMIAVVLVLGWFLYLPGDYARLGATAISSLLALSNVYFALNSSYFDPDTDKNPLLHTWSLAVEEQFYLIFPLIAFLCLRWMPRFLPWILSGLFVMSLGSMLVLLSRHPDSSYYLLHTRAWQLLAGSLLAYWHFTTSERRLPTGLGQGFVVSGLGLLVISYVFISASDGHPGSAIAVPVLGTLLIIAGGHRRRRGRGEILASRPLVLIGLASYSIYLWHQPLIVFYEEWILAAPGYKDVMLLILASLTIGFASWHWIEKPTRNGSAPFLMVFSRFLAANAAIGIAAICIVATNGATDRIPAEVRAIAFYKHPLKDLTRDCHVSQPESFTFATTDLCTTAGGDRITIGIWGSSHAASLTSGFLALEPVPTVVQGSVSSCHPFVRDRSWSKDGVDCNRAQKIIGDYFAEREDIDMVIIHSRWATFNFSREKLGVDLLRASVQKILDSGKKVILVGSVPEQNFHVPQRMAKVLLMHGAEDLQDLGVSRSAFENRQADAKKVIEAIPQHSKLLTLFLDDVYCTNNEDAYCPVSRDLTPLYFDDDHLGVEGARLAAEHIRREAKRAGFW